MSQERIASLASQHPSKAQNKAQQYAVLVPAYEPNEALSNVIHDILQLTINDMSFAGLYIIDDGSESEVAQDVFGKLQDHNKVEVIRHARNTGKGGALKTGFRQIYDRMPSVNYIVTADADGQHKPSDIVCLARKALDSERPNIGYREFSSDIPLRSRFGNILTAALFRLATGRKIRDTQSGLRTYLRRHVPKLLSIEANRYEFEFHCLFIVAKESTAPLEQYPIETIYEPGNPSSHFSPVLDSFRIYLVFLRYVSVSAISGLLEFLIFSGLTIFNLPTLTALIVTRFITAPIYFLGMRNIVFKSTGRISLQALQVIALMTAHIAFLWRFIEWLQTQFNTHPIGAMLLGMLAFYLLNFIIQRFIIFRRSKFSSKQI